jgi:GR25 family glycosyltransferase involved in LPS biosynthesis
MHQLPIFVINLDRANSRLSRISKNLRHTGLTFERVRAVEPADLAVNDKKRLNTPRLIGGELSDVETACVASHLLVWREIISRKLPLACVLEDDALLSHESIVWLTNPLMPTDAHILKLEGMSRAKTTLRHVGSYDGRSIVFSSLVSVGSACYVITQEGAKRALAKIPGLNGAIDTRIAKYWMTGINVYEVHPFPVKQDGSPSYIMTDHLSVAHIRNAKTPLRVIKKRIDGSISRAGRFAFHAKRQFRISYKALANQVAFTRSIHRNRESGSNIA